MRNMVVVGMRLHSPPAVGSRYTHARPALILFDTGDVAVCFVEIRVSSEAARQMNVGSGRRKQ
jgi:hypothetical protein